MILLPVILRFVGMLTNIAANMRQIIYGAIMALIIMSGKNGIGEYFRKIKELRSN